MSIFSRLFGESTKNIPSVCNVDIKRYAGTWYEIARLPHSFEKGLENVTATYNIQSDGKIEVINSGVKNGKKKVTRGVAWVRNKSCTGELFVSFFWIFKSEYNIIRLDEKNYSFAVVTSSTKNYLWILSRTPKISDGLYADLISYAASKGFDVSKIIRHS
ncbi:MAG TPA: lipocalin family protein [Clostridia bacterium]